MLYNHSCLSLLIPSLMLLICIIYTSYAGNNIKCIKNERNALLQFKQGIDSDNCGLLSSWVDHTDCCQWGGISCSNVTGHVTMLQLQGKGFGEDNDFCLEGNVDPSLFKLKHLRYLDLSFNEFYQTIPESIGSLTNLEYLNFSNAGFYGEIPQKLGNLSKLEYLDLNSGSPYVNPAVTNLQWLLSLKKLNYIDLSGVNLSEATQWSLIVKDLPSLRVLHLNKCQLPAIITPSSSFINSSTSFRVVSLSSNDLNDTSIFQWLFNSSKNDNKLEFLDLSYNSLSGSLPHSFENMHSLSYLDLSYNQLQGTIPNVLSNLRSLNFLSLSENKFHGSVVKSLGNLCKLKGLYLNGNMFTDDLSNVIQTLATSCTNKPSIVSLDLGANLFWGSVPYSISTFYPLRELYLDENHLNGTISQGIGQLSMLEKLDLSRNSLIGVLNHNHFSKLSQLLELYLSDNQELAIAVDSDWVPPFQLDIISLRSCKLGPDFPKWLLTQTNFSFLDISNTQISSKIPIQFWLESISTSLNLQLLNMSNNMIHGTIPNLSITMQSLCEFDLSSNYFEGSIPSFLGTYALALYLNNNMFSDATDVLCPRTSYSLTDLDLSNNLLTGELPNCWMQLDQLESLHLESNNLSGNIPTSIGAMKNLEFLHLQNNSFSGNLPASLKNCTSLVILDLGDNSLTGYIPSDIGHIFESLALLNLRRNNFVGKIPLSICHLSYLQILDLGINHFSGTIPNCIYNLTAMTSDRSNDLFSVQSGTGLARESISTNEETAVIEWKKVQQRFKSSLGLVKSMDLSDNELEGTIPGGISRLKGLISLNLSRNKFTGSIISDIGNLTSLELLDLSNNHLSGEIPKSLAEISSLGTLNLSNNNLSGEIPLGTQLQSFDQSSYSDNPLLCGAPLEECPGDERTAKSNGENFSEQDEEGNNDIFPGLYISIVLGFIIGFWGVCGTLVVKRSWRHAFFKFFDDMKNNTCMYVARLIRRKS